MEGGGGGYRIEAERWLTISEKLLTARDFQGAKSFAIRARETDPRLVEFADQIISVADTLLAGELRVINYNTGNNNHDYYAILQLPRLSQSMELVATQYRKLALLLNPTRNRLSFADHAFRLVSEAWLVFSDPSKKALYDHELQLSQLGHLGGSIQPQLGQQISFSQDYQHYQQEEEQHQHQHQHQQQVNVSLAESICPTTSTQPKLTEPIRPIPQHKAAPEPSRPTVSAQPVVTNSDRPTAKSTTRASEATRPVTKQKRPESAPANNSIPESSSARVTSSLTDPNAESFWTACPYCFILYEYPKVYEECAIRCQKCKRAFHAAVIPSPPITTNDTFFCSWSYFPLGCSVRRSGYKVVYKDDDFIDLSDSTDGGSDSDVDWRKSYTKKKNVKSGRGRSTAPGNGSGNNVKRAQNEKVKKQMIQNGDDSSAAGAGGQSNVQGVVKKGEVSRVRKRRAKDLGKLDLNVMFSNEVEDAVPSVSEGNGTGTGEEDNIGEPGFFEGLDEFFSNLPILSVVGDDKVKVAK